MVKILKFDEKDCLNFRFGVEPIAPVEELQYEEVEHRVGHCVGSSRKIVVYTVERIFCNGHAVLDIPYDTLIKRDVDWEREVTGQFSSKSKMELVLNNFRITQIKKSGWGKTVISFQCAPAK